MAEETCLAHHVFDLLWDAPIVAFVVDIGVQPEGRAFQTTRPSFLECQRIAGLRGRRIIAHLQMHVQIGHRRQRTK